MKRFKAYDPREYIDWKPDSQIMSEYQNLAKKVFKVIGDFSKEKFLDLYRNLLLVRYHDTTLKRWVKQGKISKAWLGTGEEAVTVGNVCALEKGDLVGPMIRNAGALIIKGMPLDMCLGYYLGVADNPSKGRDLHAGSLEFDTITPISHVAALVPVMTGVGLAQKYQDKDRVALTWIGDGSTRTAEFHEGVNFAAVQKAPIVFVLQNNSVALGTRYSDHYSCGLESLAEAYGVTGLVADGNHVLDVYQKSLEAIKRCRKGEGPIFLTVNTFRMGGHATHDEMEARQIFNSKEFEYWGKKDPIGCYEEFLKTLSVNLKTGKKGSEGSFVSDNFEVLGALDQEIEALMESAAKKALDRLDERRPASKTVAEGVWA